MRVPLCIIGAGPAGLMAAIFSGASEAHAVVVEANVAAGHKLLLTGGGRCNLTHAAGADELVRAFGKNGRFLRHAFHAFPPQAIQEFFDAQGLATTAEPNGCVFPETGDAANLRDILVREARRCGTHFLYRRRAKAITRQKAGFALRTDADEILAERLIIATGGVSWPQTGATGDGYRFAQTLGHTIVPPRPALVPLTTDEDWPGRLAGVSIGHVELRATLDGRTVTTRGALVFTQQGIGGPAALDLSWLRANASASQEAAINIRIDLVPELADGELDGQIRRHMTAHPKKSVANVMAGFVPRRLALQLCSLAGCDPARQAAQLIKAMRKRLTTLLKRLPLCVTGTEPIAKATVTHGGVHKDEIDLQTMESKICPGLFFAGEVIDVDGPCGGYNLHMCWSTGALAATSAARSLQPSSEA